MFLCGTYLGDSEGFCGWCNECDTIEVWHKCFKDSWESVESGPCTGRPATSRTPENVEHVWAAIDKDGRLTVWELEAGLGVPKTTVSEIFIQDLGMKHVMAKFVLQLLLPEQKEHCAAVANDLIQITTNESDFLKKVITGDELWVYSYNPETKAQSSQWKLPCSPHPKKVQQSCNKIKTMLTVFFWLGRFCPS